MKYLVSLIAFLTVVVSQGISGTEFYGVLVGIDDYPDPFSDRPYAINDIDDIFYSLERVGKYKKSHMAYVHNQFALKDAIKDAIDTVGAMVDYDDVFLFHFSGHGDDYYQSEGLVPWDYWERIDETDLNSWFSGVGTNKIVVIIDADYAGYFNNKLTKGVVLMACEDDEYAQHPSDLKNGVFTCYVAEGMEGWADFFGGSISAEEAFSFAYPYVVDYTEDEQHPMMDDNYLPYDLVFLNKIFTVNGEMTSSEIWSGNISLSGNVTISSGSQLRLLANNDDKNTEVDLMGYYLKSTGGAIDKNLGVKFKPKEIAVKSGSTLKGQYSTIQSAINNASSGQDVCPGPGTYSENITMKSGVDVDGTNNVTIDGNVYFNSVSNAKLQDVTVTETIFVNNNSSGIDIDRVDRIYSYGCGIDLYNSSADIWQFDISNNTKGIYSHGSSVADISYCDITDITWGLKLYGSTSTDVWGMGFCNNNYDIWLEEGGYIWIEEDNMMFSGDAEEVT